MTKQELIDKIKQIAKDKYAKQIKYVSGSKFNVVNQFPIINDVLNDLMSDQYEIFITDVEWVAPKPTTFRIMLGNGEYFFLTYTKKSWEAQVEGKNFYLLNLNEKEDAINSIARVLRYGKTKPGTEPAPNNEVPTEEVPEELPPA
jgi:hypothetical protein